MDISHPLLQGPRRVERQVPRQVLPAYLAPSADVPPLAAPATVRRQKTKSKRALHRSAAALGPALAPGSIPATLAEINRNATSKGGFTRALVESWGVPWPLTSGWKKALVLRQSEAIHQRPTPQTEQQKVPLLSEAKRSPHYHPNYAGPKPTGPAFDSKVWGLEAAPKIRNLHNGKYID